jgi:hypothetical protein
MWKKLKEAKRAIGDAQSRLVIADGRIDSTVGDDGMTYVAAKEALEAVGEELAKAAQALKEVEDKFTMRDTYSSGGVYRVQAGNNGASSPPPTEESEGDERAGESDPTVSPVPRNVPLDSRSGGNELWEEEDEGGCSGEVDAVAPLAAVSFAYGKRDACVT